MVAAAERRGLLGPPFFDALERERPGRADDSAGVRALWRAGGPTAEPAAAVLLRARAVAPAGARGLGGAGRALLLPVPRSGRGHGPLAGAARPAPRSGTPGRRSWSPRPPRPFIAELGAPNEFCESVKMLSSVKAGTLPTRPICPSRICKVGPLTGERSEHCVQDLVRRADRRPAGRPGWPARWPPGARPSAAGVAISATW